MKAIADAWRFAERASHKPEDSSHPLVADSLIFTPMWNDTDYAFIAEFSDRIVIAFCPTSDDLGWVSNFDILPLAGKSEWESDVVHKGFFTSWEYFEPSVTQYLLQYIKQSIGEEDVEHVTKKSAGSFWRFWKLKSLLITGHSRGGALGTLCSGYVGKQLDIPHSAIFFGCPRAGTKDFRDQYNMLPVDCTRVINGRDIVAQVPPDSTGARAVGKEVVYPPHIGGWFTRKKDLIRDHYHSRYTQSIMADCQSSGDAVGVAAMQEVLKECTT
jgi:hypothetical protein